MAEPALGPSQIALLGRIAQVQDRLDFGLISVHDDKLASDLAELERHGLIRTTERPSPWMNSREVTATLTDLGRALLRGAGAPSADSP